VYKSELKQSTEIN